MWQRRTIACLWLTVRLVAFHVWSWAQVCNYMWKIWQCAVCCAWVIWGYHSLFTVFCMLPEKQRISVNNLILLVRFPVDNSMVIVKFLRNQNLCFNFWLRMSMPLAVPSRVIRTYSSWSWKAVLKQRLNCSSVPSLL